VFLDTADCTTLCIYRRTHHFQNFYKYSIGQSVWWSLGSHLTFTHCNCSSNRFATFAVSKAANNWNISLPSDSQWQAKGKMPSQQFYWMILIF